MSEGCVIDLGRMKTIKFDEKNWVVKVGAGVAAFDLQKAAVMHGYRAFSAGLFQHHVFRYILFVLGELWYCS
jgi:FAD/FMN-containing dehydrogenase